MSDFTYPEEDNMGGLKKNKLVLLGVDTGFIMGMLVCPRKSLQCNKLSDSGVLNCRGKKVLFVAKIWVNCEEIISCHPFYLLFFFFHFLTN